MFTIYNLLVLMHLIGFSLGVGSATVKLVLLFRCYSNHEFLNIYLKVTKPVTKLIVVGMILLTLSGIGWLFVGYPFTTLLIVKVGFVGLIWVLGPIIDNVVEPKFEKLAPLPGDLASPAFTSIQRKHLALEIAATVLMYTITIMGVLL